MKPVSIACFLLLICWQAAAQAPQPTDAQKTRNSEKCTVAGTVIRLDSSEPLKKAMVVLRKLDRKETVLAITDAQGHFQFDSVEPGSYGLQVSHNGFLTLLYGQRKPDSPGANLTLSPGQKMTDLIFKLLRSASISGRIMDEDGEPLPNVQVKPYRVSSRRGRTGLSAVGETLTNDLGEYRIFGLPPGRYYIRAHYHAQNFNLDGIPPSSPQTSKEDYPPTFYPNTPDPAKASPITAKARNEISSVDFMLKPSHVVTVSGRVLNTLEARPGFHLNVTLLPRGAIFDEGGDVYLMALVSNKQGTFEIRNVFPGSYIAHAWWSNNEEHFSAQRELEVGDSDVEGVNLTISPGVDVPGHLVWEEKAPSEGQSSYVSLRALDEDPYSNNPAANDLKPDGSFLIKNVPEGVYRPHVYTGNPDCFIKSARYGTVEVADGGLAPHPGADASLELKMSCRAARIEGVAMTGDSLPAAGVFVVAIPDAPHCDQQWKYRSVVTDQNGRFLLQGIVPGEYRIFSWDSGDDFNWYDTEQLKPYESKGVSISVQEGDRKTVQLQVIEIENASQTRQ